MKLGPVIGGVLLALVVACGGGSSDPTPTPSPEPSPSPSTTPSPTPNPFGVRFCEYSVGNEGAEMPAEVVRPPSRTPLVTATLPPQATVDAATTRTQLDMYDQFITRIEDTYVYPDYNGVDFPELDEKYRTLIEDGLTQEDFYFALGFFIFELGDDHSYFETPEEAADAQSDFEGTSTFVGMGAFANPIDGALSSSVVTVYPDSPAEEAGLKPHDILLTVDGEPYYNEVTNQARSLGEEGTSFELTYERDGEERATTITRRALTGGTPIEFCLVPDTRIGYINIPTWFDESIDEKVADALTKMTGDGPLEGLVIDERVNDGGVKRIVNGVLNYFTEGTLGRFVRRDSETELVADGTDIGGSQSVPLVVLVDRDTESFAEIFAGALHHESRATVIGGNTQGNVEILAGGIFPDGSTVWLATETFVPTGEEAGLWEGIGITPDIRLPTRWELFTEASDPALAKAVEVLQGG